MKTPARFDELLDAFEFVSAGQPMEQEAYLCVETGVIYYHSDFTDDEPLPEDIDDAQKYIAIPHQNELGLGSRLVMRFAAEVLPDDLGEIKQIFGRRGAYSRAKDFFHRRGVLQQWYDYEAKGLAEALRQWCEAVGIEIDESRRNTNG